MRKKAIEQKKANYLDLIPVPEDSIRWYRDTIRERVILERENTGFFNVIVQKIFAFPKISNIQLDQTGTFIWSNLDGNKTVEDVASLVKSQFGQSAEPLYPRLIQYLEILRQNGFISLKEKFNS